jgi:hypothetical protein
MNQLLKAFLWFFVLAGCIGANAGQWRLIGGGTFVGEEQWTEGDGWVGRVEGRSQNHILVSQSTTRGGLTSKTARLEWAGAPQVLQPGEMPPLPARATIVQMTNPSGMSINTNVDCFIKTPYRSFWQGTIPMRQGGTLELRNTELRIPEGSTGSRLTLVYRISGFGTAKDTEFTYEWLGSASQGGGDHANTGLMAGLEGTWTINGRPTSITQGSGESLIFTNEGGATSRGRLLDANTVIAIDWAGGLRGSLQDRGNTIRWANGTVWTRSTGTGMGATAGVGVPQAPNYAPSPPTYVPRQPVLPSIGGGWLINRQVSISQSDNGDLLFINESGDRSSGRFLDQNTVIATDWAGGLRGTLLDGGKSIRWANGTVWYRPRSDGR